ncbi:MAG: hypothetical protein ABR981_01850 [Candidatus Micrarchaeaceae archaeon]|jgi:hypothetical protein
MSKKRLLINNISIKATSIPKEEIFKRDIAITKKYFTRAYKLNQNMFSGITPNFRIVLCYSRKEFDKELGWKTGKWEAAVSDKRRIFIFAPSVWNRLTDNNHLFHQTLTHEMNHIFYENFVGAPTPQWLLEGLGMLVDGTGKNFGWKGKSKIKYLAFSLKERWKIQSKSNNDALEFYKSSYLATKRIVNKLGIQGLMKLVAKYAECPVKKSYDMVFEGIL